MLATLWAFKLRISWREIEHIVAIRSHAAAILVWVLLNELVECGLFEFLHRAPIQEHFQVVHERHFATAVRFRASDWQLAVIYVIVEQSDQTLLTELVLTAV